MPLRTAPIPCSRTPKWKFRPARLAAANTPPPLISVLFDQVGQFRRDGVDGLPRRGPRRLRVSRTESGQRRVPSLGQTALDPALQLGGEVGVRLAVRRVASAPLALQAGAARR